VLWERESTIDGLAAWRGYTDNYIAVYAAGENLGNRITAVRLGRAVADGVLGSPPGVTA
jgi:hypothetical protein